jgi:hypothetical protein
MDAAIGAMSPAIGHLLAQARSGLHRLDPASSLAAASPQALGLREAADLIGGFQAWRAAGLPAAAPGHLSRPRLPRLLDDLHE